MPVPSGIAKAQQAASPPPGVKNGDALGKPTPATEAKSSFSAPRAAPSIPPRPIVSRSGPKAGGGGFRAGSTVNHPKYGRGTVLRREGDGEDAKLTISFVGVGLKKIVEKFAGIKVEE
jgi:DNA helicase-2/ATP-dependent DNA helicase PcrA